VQSICRFRGRFTGRTSTTTHRRRRRRLHRRRCSAFRTSCTRLTWWTHTGRATSMEGLGGLDPGGVRRAPTTAAAAPARRTADGDRRRWSADRVPRRTVSQAVTRRRYTEHTFSPMVNLRLAVTFEQNDCWSRYLACLFRMTQFRRHLKTALFQSSYSSP